MNKEVLVLQTGDKTEKILSLQQELLNVRKQFSKKQWQWEKEKVTLLNKNQICNIQIIELKQRISNFEKINQTLTNAITSQHQAIIIESANSKQRKMFNCPEIDINFTNFASNGDEQGRKQKNNEQIKRLTKIIEEKDFQIKNLNKIGNQLRNKIQQRNSVVSNLQETVYNLKCKIEKKQQQILRIHKQVQQLQEKLQQNELYIDEIRYKSSMSKKTKCIQEIEEPTTDFIKKYSTKNSPYLKMKPTPDHSGCEIDNNSSYINQIETSQPDTNSDDQDKLLCEICSRVFSFANFEQHAKYCGYKARNNTRHLLQRKKEIQEKLQKIRQQEEKQNMKNRYSENENYYEKDEGKKDKISPIFQISQQIHTKRFGSKNVCEDFPIKKNAFYF